MAGPIWLGYTLQGRKLHLEMAEVGRGAIILGERASDIGSLFAYACREAGLSTLVIDVVGSMARRVSGYFETYDHNAVLYDSMKIGEDARQHAQLVASAYALALNLSPLQEAILDAALQEVVAQGPTAGPSALYELVGGVEGFPGWAVEELRGRLAALTPLKVLGEVGVLERCLRGGCLVDLSGLEPAEAQDVAANLVIAKALYLLQSLEGVRLDCLIINEAHRLFPHNPNRQAGRLLLSLLAAPTPRITVSSLPAALHPYLVEGSSLRIYSSELWNRRAGEAEPVLPNMAVIEHTAYGFHETFIPRGFEPRGARPPGQALRPEENRELEKLILQIIDAGWAPTRLSAAAYLSPHYPRAAIEAAIDRLHQEGYVAIVPAEARPGTRIFALKLTVAGKRYLEELSRG
jgi:hypothetical protein